MFFQTKDRKLENANDGIVKIRCLQIMVPNT